MTVFCVPTSHGLRDCYMYVSVITAVTLTHFDVCVTPRCVSVIVL
jgi:hypothetical protein